MLKLEKLDSFTFLQNIFAFLVTTGLLKDVIDKKFRFYLC